MYQEEAGDTGDTEAPAVNLSLAFLDFSYQQSESH